MPTARLAYRTVRDLVTNAARFAGTDDALPVFKQLRFRLAGDHIEARATDRYAAVWYRAPLTNGQAWPSGLDLGLTVRQWRTILATLRPARGTHHLDSLLEFNVRAAKGDKPGHVTVTRTNPEAKPNRYMEDNVGSLTLIIPGGEFPNIDGLAHINPDALDGRPLPSVALDGQFLARLPRDLGLVIVPTTREDNPDPRKAAGPVHIVSDSWHAVIMTARLDDTWGRGHPAPGVPAQWLTPTTNDHKEAA